MNTSVVLRDGTPTAQRSSLVRPRRYCFAETCRRGGQHGRDCASSEALRGSGVSEGYGIRNYTAAEQQVRVSALSSGSESVAVRSLYDDPDLHLMRCRACRRQEVQHRARGSSRRPGNRLCTEAEAPPTRAVTGTAGTEPAWPSFSGEGTDRFDLIPISSRRSGIDPSPPRRSCFLRISGRQTPK